MKKYNDEELNKKLLEYQKNKSIKIRNEIAILCIDLVSYVSYPYSVMNQIKIEEIESYGYEGLLNAIETYNMELGTFSNYAYRCIKNRIRLGIEELKGYPQTYYWYFLQNRRQIEKENNKYLEFNPDVFEELIEELKNNEELDTEKIDNIKKIYYINNYQPIKENNIEVSLNNIEKEVIEKISSEELSNKIKLILYKLPIKERLIVMYNFGFFNNEVYSLRKLEEIFELSHEGIRYYKNKALKKIKYYAEHEKLNDYYKGMKKNDRKI